jgi:hypothetical protein
MCIPTHGSNAEGVPVGLVLDTTSFYAESGGQVGTASRCVPCVPFVFHWCSYMAVGSLSNRCAFTQYCYVLCRSATLAAAPPWRCLASQYKYAAHTDDVVCCALTQLRLRVMQIGDTGSIVSASGSTLEVTWLASSVCFSP